MGECIGGVVVVNALRKFGCDAGTTIAFVQITQADHVFIVLREGTHRIGRGGGRTIGIRRGLGAVAGRDHLDGRACVGWRCVAIARVDRETICRPANQGHGFASVAQLGNQSFWNAVVVVHPVGLHMSVAGVCSPLKEGLAQCLQTP